MIKRGILFLFICMFVGSIFISNISLIIAEEHEEELDSFDDFEEDVELEVAGGITPDSFFYFLDDFFDRFSDELGLREEKIAEIITMIEEGKVEEAKVALEKYKEYSENFEREVSPEEREEARRSASAIYNALRDIEGEIPEEDKEDFFDDILERERAIITAAEIASKIKELCRSLSELDPLEYSRVCKTDEDAPGWHKELDRELTEEQKDEAAEFFGIMSECFETSGGECRCEDISIPAFSEKCSVIAPLAYACDVEDNEDACDEMDVIEEEEPIEDLLPDYLRAVLRDVEDRFEDAQFDRFAPRECIEAGATTRSECETIMFRIHAPEECIEALETGELDFDNEREAREICEEIMFQAHAPEECIEAGLTDHRECGILMFQAHAPEECIEAGLTGENRGDERACRELMEGFEGEHHFGGPGPGINFDCREIENPEERLKCYDRASSQVEGYHEIRRDDYAGPCLSEEEFERRIRDCKSSCSHCYWKPIQGDSGEGYDCAIDLECGEDLGSYEEKDYEPSREFEGYDCSVMYCQEGTHCEPDFGCVSDHEESRGEGEEFNPCKDCSSWCGGTPSRTECIDGNRCECYYDGPLQEEPITDQPIEEETPDTSTQEESTTDVTSEPESEPESSPITGAAISGNKFLDYFYG